MEEDVQNFSTTLQNYVAIDKIAEATNLFRSIVKTFDNENLTSSTRGKISLISYFVQYKNSF